MNKKIVHFLGIAEVRDAINARRDSNAGNKELLYLIKNYIYCSCQTIFFKI
jgi:hypothetical protein